MFDKKMRYFFEAWGI